MSKWKHKILLIGTLMSVFVMSALSAFAQGIQFNVEVDRRQVTLDSAIQMTMTFQGLENPPEIRIPNLPDFDVRYVGPSTNIRVYNGQYSSAKSFIYSLYPKQTGTFNIPSFKFELNGQAFASDPIPIEVIAKGESSSGGSQTLSDSLFVRIQMPKDTAYINEAVPIKVILFVGDVPFKDIQYPKLDSLGIFVEDFTRPKQYQKIISGVKFTIFEFSTLIYPTRTGEVKISSATLEGNIIIEQGNQSGRRSLFGDDFFDSFFNQYEKRPMSLSTDELVLNVLPLPDEGKPENFSNAVGQYEFDVTLSPTELKEGDPITLRMTIKGAGNLKAIEFPKLQDSKQFKVYDPEIKEESLVKTLEQVVIPKSKEITEFPAVEFSFFDTEFKKYRTVKKGPFPITVKEVDASEKFQMVGLNPSSVIGTTPEEIGSDIVFIKERLGRLYKKGRSFHHSFLIYIGLVFVFMFWIGSVILYNRNKKFQTDSAYYRRTNAPKSARKGLEQAKRYLQSSQKEKFYDELFRTMQNYLKDRYHISAGTLDQNQIEKFLSENKVDAKIIQAVLIIYRECDMVRYASAQLSDENMNKCHSYLTKIIDYLEKTK